MRLEEILEDISRRGFLKGAAGAAGLAVAGGAQAKGKWVLIWDGKGTDTPELKSYLDTNSIVKVGNYTYECWTKDPIFSDKPNKHRVDVKNRIVYSLPNGQFK
jgi:anaerobic selenocysteine-containing dehydrogenase